MKTSRIRREAEVEEDVDASSPPGDESSTPIDAPHSAVDATRTPGSAEDRQRSVTAIAAAVGRLRDTLAGREDIPAAACASANEMLDGVHEDLVDRLQGDEPTALADPDQAPGRLRLLQLLQSELLHIWTRLTAEPPSRDELLAVLSEVDQMMVSLEPHGRERVMAMVESESPLTMVVQLAHDLRSPLTSVLFLAELLQRGRSGPVTDMQQRQLGVIYSAAFALVAVANDVIELARGGGTSLTAESEVPFSLSECLGTIREMMQPMAEDKGIELRVVTPNDDRRMGRPSALSRALLNLATNAVKFTEDGFVELAAEATDWQQIRFTVTDTGRGMTPDAERNLFQPFQKSERRKGVFFSSSGLGLSIVRRIVTDLGGQLTYETRLNHGTRFEFTLRLPSATDLHA